jgi:PD-(D/E)XK nuclease superfamily
VGKRDLAAILGTAFAAGVAIYHQALKEGAPCDVAVAQATAVASVREKRAELESLGCVVRPEDISTADKLEMRVTGVLGGYISEAPIPTDWEILHVEHTFESFGNGRIDLGVATPLGLAIADVKLKLTLADKYYRAEKEKYRTDWQMAHYVWAYSQFMGRPVREYYIILVVLEPFSVEVIPYAVTPEGMLAWEASAAEAWRLMEGQGLGEGGALQNRMQCERWQGFPFPCDYYDACHSFYYKENLMRTKYVKKLRDPLPMPQPMPMPKPFEPVS